MPPLPDASRTDAENTAFVASLRRELQDGMPYGGWTRVQNRLVGINANVEEQQTGRNRLTVNVLTEALLEFPREEARRILDELVLPLGFMVVRRPGTSESTSPVAASGALIAAAGTYAAALGRAMADGSLDAKECATLRRDLAEIGRTYEQLEVTLGSVP